MSPKIVFNVVAHFFIILFLYAGGTQLMDLSSATGIEPLSLPGRLNGIFALGLPILQLLLAITLFVPSWRVRGLYGTLSLLTLYLAYLLILPLFGNNGAYVNLGIIGGLSLGKHLILNGAFIGLTALGLFAGRKCENLSSFRVLSTITVASLLGVMAWLWVSADQTTRFTKTGLEGQALPSFKFLLLDSTTQLDTKSIPTGSRFFITAFSPYCPHCQRQISEIVRNIQKFRRAHFYLISSYSISEVKAFCERFHLEKYDEITIGIDESSAFLSYFGAHVIPFTAIYNKEKELSVTIPGRANTDLLLQYGNN